MLKAFLIYTRDFVIIEFKIILIDDGLISIYGKNSNTEEFTQLDLKKITWKNVCNTVTIFAK